MWPCPLACSPPPENVSSWRSAPAVTDFWLFKTIFQWRDSRKGLKRKKKRAFYLFPSKMEPECGKNMKLPWSTFKTYWNSPKIFLDTLEDSWKCLWNTLNNTLKLPWTMKFSWNTFETSFSTPWNTLETRLLYLTNDQTNWVTMPKCEKIRPSGQ